MGQHTMKLPVSRLLKAGLLVSAAVLLLPSCAVTAAQNEPLVPITQIKPEPIAQGKRVLPHAMWVWDATAITNPQKGQDLFDFCAKKGISVIYLSMGDIFSPKQREATDPKHVTAPMLGKFLSAAHGKRIEVEALDGDPSFALQDKHAEALGRLQKALDYNKTAAENERLDGFQWDTEPYILEDFKKDAASQRAVLKQYLDSAAQMRDAVKASPTLRLGYAIPAFFDEDARSVEWDGITKPVTFHLMDILNTLPTTYVAIMAYRDKALGVNGTVEISRGEVAYATKSTPNVKVWIGQETLDVKGDPPSITFWQEGENALNAALGQIQGAYQDKPVVAGLAIHHWGSYRILKAGDPVTPPAPTAPITEPLTILTPKDSDGVPRRMEVSGTAKPGGEGIKVEVSVKPEGDIWYSQGEIPISAEGTWSVTCRFGNENTPAGRAFAVRAQLKKADGSMLTEQTINVKTN
ncbi:hypothetical protein IAD21_05656 [Abditibacteriota bacterium]|nr:hypothetical protein IAD21_05656 [Abditibacteriota bacterium]